MIKLIEVSFNTGNKGGKLGPTSSKNTKAIAVKLSGIQYCLFIYMLVNKLHFVKILGYLTKKIFSGFINSCYLDTSVFLKKAFDTGKFGRRSTATHARKTDLCHLFSSFICVFNFKKPVTG